MKELSALRQEAFSILKESESLLDMDIIKQEDHDFMVQEVILILTLGGVKISDKHYHISALRYKLYKFGEDN